MTKIAIPRELKPLSRSFRMFVDMMLTKLHVNRHKGFGDVPYTYLLRGLHDEMRELEEALRKDDQMAIMAEAADVANFAYLIALRATTQTRVQFREETNQDDHRPSVQDPAGPSARLGPEMGRIAKRSAPDGFGSLFSGVHAGPILGSDASEE